MTKFKILIGCTGSVASIKLPNLIEKLNEKLDCEIKVVLTEAAKNFINLQNINVPVFNDTDEWEGWKEIGDEILHISLREWADVMIIAPLDANTLGKLAHGLCDNLLTCIVRAWRLGERPLLICPAMNTWMWRHPATEEALIKLRSWGYMEIAPISKKLACGDEGIGAMENVDRIVDKLNHVLNTDS